MLPNPQRSRIIQILLTAFVAGSLDMLCAMLWYAVILDKTSSLQILQSVASGILGKAAYAGGMRTALIGLVLHFGISTAFTAVYFFMFARNSFLRNHPFASGVCYGLFIWLVMNLLVLPLAFGSIQPTRVSSVVAALSIVIICFGIPISYLTAYFRKV